MALVIEDGTLVAGATSYIDVAYLRAYGEARGRTVPADDTAAEIAIINGMDKLESFARRFAGVPTYEDQETAFPRSGIPKPSGYCWMPANEIPEAIKKAQAEFSLASANGVDLMPTLTDAPVKREKVGPLETEYETDTRVATGPVVAAAEALLSPFFTARLFRTVRA